MSVKKNIPNAITSLNLVCGVIGIIFTLSQHKPEIAFYFMLAAVAFDFLDGFAARMLGAYSEMGKELDSLADMVSFGVLPSMMMLETYASGGHGLSIIWAAPILIAVFSALRLAKFNVDERQHESFIGLPTPSAALICGSLCALSASEGLGWIGESIWLIPAISLALCYLLVCEMPMFSFKFGKEIEADTVTKMLRYALLSIAAIVAVLVLFFGLPWPAIILGIFLVYILENALFQLLSAKND
ncbi:MAG: CDP-diacylglycerol--serine O-phosphatidyltransferase [Bacteroidales bacterium]|nr:CDP-diacylglycerol--serine O-phosphatidyltransferase [Bacteroidales bacterium]